MPLRFPLSAAARASLLVGWCLSALAARGDDTIKRRGLEIKPTGIYTFHGITFSTGLIGPDYQVEDQSALKPSPGSPSGGEGLQTYQGEVGRGTAAGGFSLTETLGPENPGSDTLAATYRVEKSDLLPFRSVSLLIDLPIELAAGRTLSVDQLAVPLPAETAKNTLLYHEGVKEIRLPSRDGTLILQRTDGTFTVEIQDERRWGGNTFRLRVLILDARQGTGGALSMRLSSVPFRHDTVALRQAANRGFRDDVAGDGKGGWTDQGPENDLACLKPGPLSASRVDFDVIDPQTNGGESCIVLSGDKPELPKTVNLPFAGADGDANLYLLHAAAWLPSGDSSVGTVRVRYADGTSQSYDVQGHRDIGDWWAPAPLRNGAPGWTGRNESADVGLFVSRFALDPAKKVTGFQLEATSAALWMVVAMTASPDHIPLVSDLPLVMRAGPVWAPYELQYHIASGSVFDFSALNDAPAGKYGRLVPTPAGHLEFAGRPGLNQRFWGVNLTFGANYLDKEAADGLAEQLARSGYNTVRFHHYDGMLVKQGGKSFELDPAQWDKLDYLFAAMKQRGIYANIDLFTIRKFTHEEIPEIDGDSLEHFKAVLPVSDAAFEAWKRFAKNVLTHRNPYTGLSWGEDPALIGICPINEDPLYITLNEKSPASIQKLYLDKFEQWKAANPLFDQSDAGRNEAYNRFLAETQIANDRRMAAYIRSLGVPTMLTGVNCGTSEAQTFPREQYDYVDNHTYLDHPSFIEKPWSLPMLFRQSNPLQGRADAVRGLMPDRIFGKPYEVTELHFCWPNRYRSTTGVLTAGYASLQDWDAIYNFDYAGSSTNVTAAKEGQMFHLVNDPIALLADRVGAVVFRRGDVQPASGAVAFSVSETSACAGGRGRPREFPQNFSLLGLVTRIGCVTTTPDKTLASDAARRGGVTAVVADGAQSAPGVFPENGATGHALMHAGVVPPSSMDDSGSRYTSETGQIELAAKPGMVKVVSDRSEMFSLPPETRADGKIASVENGETFGSLHVLSADGKPLAQCGRILVVFLTDSVYTGTAFRSGNETVLENFGQLPVLVQRGTARLTLRLPETAGADWKAWVVDVNGTRRQPVAIGRENGAWVLPASTATDGSGSLAWELSRSR